jgi:hypothetical protein
MGEKWEYNETVYQLFTDFKAPYDSVRREVLHNILIEFGIPMKLFRLIKMCLNEIYSEFRMNKYLFDSFSIHRGLKEGDGLSPLLFNFALEYAIRKVQEIQVELKLNVTHQLLAYTDDVNLLGDNIDSINKSTETLLDASKEVGLDINVDKTKSVSSPESRLKSGHKNSKQVVCKCVPVQIFGNDSNKSKFDSGGK